MREGGGGERARGEEEENGRGAERADRCLLRWTVKPSMPLAFDNYSRLVLGDMRKMSVFVHACVNAHQCFATHFFQASINVS